MNAEEESGEAGAGESEQEEGDDSCEEDPEESHSGLESGAGSEESERPGAAQRRVPGGRPASRGGQNTCAAAGTEPTDTCAGRQAGFLAFHRG